MTQEPVEEDASEIELTDEDILDAMAHVPGYIDISTEDFRAIYHLAWRHAMARLLARKADR
jgi:CBS-domain-containing membrane protein